MVERRVVKLQGPASKLASDPAASKKKQIVNLSFSCKDLPNVDVFSLSDPFIVLYKLQDAVWKKIGITEVIQDDLNP